eukprot:3384364-Rhodomonas_salina.1
MFTVLRIALVLARVHLKPPQATSVPSISFPNRCDAADTSDPVHIRDEVSGLPAALDEQHRRPEVH